MIERKTHLGADLHSQNQPPLTDMYLGRRLGKYQLIKRIGEGPSEIMRMVIARNLVGGRTVRG